MWVQCLVQEDPLEEEMAPHSSTLAWKIPWMEATVHGVTKSRTQLSDFTFFLSYLFNVLLRLKSGWTNEMYNYVIFPTQACFR